MRVLTKEELWMEQAPSWNFELDEEQMLVKALELGFVTEAGKNSDGVSVYEINENYGSER